MELKQFLAYTWHNTAHLLIVPYGIETTTGGCCKQEGELLIVPYGIETKMTRAYSFVAELLIVPYGIETYSRCAGSGSALAFNRTLWN